MPELKHLFPTDTARAEPYTYARKVVSAEFKVPPRDDRPQHSAQLIEQIETAENEAKEAEESRPAESRPKGIALDFCSEPDFKLQLDSLEMRRSGIELVNSRTVDGVMHATVFVPEGKSGIFVRKFEKYAKETTAKGKPKNKDLTESISHIRLAVLRSFWTDAGDFPKEQGEPIWWEVWLRERTNPHDVSDQFRELAAAAGIDVSVREIRFPERRVLLARASIEQLSLLENLFDVLAELRLAKWLPSEFVALPPREQSEWIDAALTRIQSPPANAPAVCHLDTGVNRGHPLLSIALAEDHCLAVEPEWSPADLHGHGTEMAGIALYGCLTDLFSGDGPLPLRHRLESVKILPDQGENRPDLYGDVTGQAISRAEIASPQRARVVCLTVTADGRDEGYPSSWSGAMDRICVGVDDDIHRLVCVSAGNTPVDGRHRYPEHNYLHGVDDPAYAWNAITVGAFTERAVIQDADYDGWQPIAAPGRLSPATRTSIVWSNRSWPLKPDIVMEGGNNAIDPATGFADNVDDLSLLTTRVSPSGALLTTTGDTSAAAEPGPLGIARTFTSTIRHSVQNPCERS
jgi:hypothetical protein